MSPSLQHSSPNSRVGHLHQAGKGVVSTQADLSASVADRAKSISSRPESAGTDVPKSPKSPTKATRLKNSESNSALRVASSAVLATNGPASSGERPVSPSNMSTSSGGLGPSSANGLKRTGTAPAKSGASPSPMSSLLERLQQAEKAGKAAEKSDGPGSPGPPRRTTAPANVDADKVSAEKSPSDTKEETATTPPVSPTARRSSAPIDRLSSLRSRRTSAKLNLKVDTDREPAKGIRMLKPGEKIFDVYYWETVLQEDGDGGKVVICQDRKDDTEDKSDFKYVMKIRSKKSLEEVYNMEQYRRTQLRMLNFPPHVGVMPLHEVLEDDSFFYVVAPRASGGSYFAGLLQEWRDGVVPASALKKNIKEIMQAVGHMHQCGVLHRDIKPDNLVTEVWKDPESPTGKANRPVLIDFDHADTDFSPLVASPKAQECFGTLRFNAPETFLGEYSAQSDLYSVGVILYMLMAGKMPFNDDIFPNEAEWAASPTAIAKFQRETFERLRDRPVDWSCDPWPQQPTCKDFCLHLLAFDPEERFRTAEDALAHPWFVSDD